MSSNNLFKELIKMLAFFFFFLAVAELVVMGGSYNSLMFGNAFYRLELGKDIRMLFFYCKNIPSANLLGKAQPFLYRATGSNFMQKRRI